MGFISIQNNKFSCTSTLNKLLKLGVTYGMVGTTNCITLRTGRSTVRVSDNARSNGWA